MSLIDAVPGEIWLGVCSVGVPCCQRSHAVRATLRLTRRPVPMRRNETSSQIPWGSFGLGGREPPSGYPE